jgi:hypothetical protein
MNSRNNFVGHLMNMPFARLVKYIYWDNHGGDNMDIESSDWTMAMLLEVINDDDWQEFSANYVRFLEETA